MSSKFPRVYAESTLKRRYTALALPEETVDLLHDYFEAMANFYMRLSLKDAFYIFNLHNKGLITKEQFIDFSDIVRHEQHYYYVLGDDELYTQVPKSEPHERFIVHESLIDIDYEIYYNMERMQSGKPLYIPSMEKLLKHINETYYEETPQTKALAQFFTKKLHKSSVAADMLVTECHMIVINSEKPFIRIFDEFDRMGLELKESWLDEISGLLQALCNNTRLPCNRGFTPIELSNRLGGRREFDLQIGFPFNK